ncbi:hypothetical protein CLV92_11877 [Kineococcus xinjiangensis]|uniref:Uncharacterized protein n=1 Tax=Kineococcus xinjiangensis TaxID=512762 RepID=A0A2S6ICY5_9ACTN|nr:hypothetical protein [Kineococcus xinjiangensis]PPK92033.1 hypothetical protein CLV92_11877 [Kineococcus xinjiangensis]
MTHAGQHAVRVYLPTTLARLQQMALGAETAPLAVAPVQVHGVTPALREWYVDADPKELEEELEYAASSDAAERSLHLLASEPDAPRRRVVLALDLPAAAVAAVPAADLAGTGRSALLAVVDVPRSALVSVHVDDEEAVADVQAAVLALDAAAAGDEDAQFVVGAAEGHELLWYDASEIEDLTGSD